MPLIPKIVSFDTEIESKRVRFIGYYSKSEDINIYWYDLKDNTLITRFTREFDSSVWIHDREMWEKFAQIYSVRSGVWAGSECGGRWTTLKKTDGEIIFNDVYNFKRNDFKKTSEIKFIIKKPCFSNLIRIEVNNETAGHLTFICKKIIIQPTHKIYLHHREKNDYINATNILEPGGLGLAHSYLNL